MKLFEMINGDTVHLAAGQKVIPSKDFSKLLTSKELVDKIKEELKEKKKEMAIEAEKAKEEGFQEGFTEGLEKWAQQISYLEDEIKKVFQEVEKIAIPLALKSAKKIVGREIEVNPKVIVDIVANQLRAVAEHKKVTVYVNREDLIHLEKNKAKLEKLFSNLESLSIQENQDVDKSGCIIETEVGIINAQISNQWKILEQVFENMLQQASSSKSKEKDT